MGIMYEPNAWTDTLWQRHFERSRSARQAVYAGEERQAAYPAFATDLHAALYLRHAPKEQAEPPAWAHQLMTAARDLPEWQQLRSRCERSGFAAAVATESLLHALAPLIPQEQKPSPKQEQAGNTGLTAGDNGQQSGTGEGNEQAIRRGMRQAIRKTAKDVIEAEAATDAFKGAMGIDGGNEDGTRETIANTDQLLEIWQAIRHNAGLRRLAELAGRLKRLGHKQKLSTVTPAVGRVKGVTVGGDLDRILPHEFIGLRSGGRMARYETLARICGKRALQYEMSGTQALARGPMVVLLDESASMAGDSELRSKAVALALLSMANEQSRGYHLVGFNKSITHEHHHNAGSAESLSTLLEWMGQRASGGTDFDAPLETALDILSNFTDMKQADVIMITDGHPRRNEVSNKPEIAPSIVQAINAERKERGLHVYVVGIGHEFMREAVAPIADEIMYVDNLQVGNEDKVASILAHVA